MTPPVTPERSRPFARFLPRRRATPTGYQFGTVKGVYIPSLLTILGVIMYLRTGWVLGQVGLMQTLLIVTLASAVTFITGLSIASLATNMQVRVGGAYYIISRSLGLEAGAAIGLPLFLAKALGIAFYIVGFSESITLLFPHLSEAVVGVATLAGLTLLAYVSADLSLRMQSLILGGIIASLVSFFIGSGPAMPLPAVTLTPSSSSLLPFWAVFAVFFPAVTGIEAGLSMSGDLRNPSAALPRGTIAAVLTGYVIYLAIPIALAAAAIDRHTLLTNSLIMRDVARWGDLVIIGLWGAALSSALGALLGAPRTLQAMASDGIVPRVLGRGFGKGNDPRLATVLSCLIGLVGILAGGLNVIGPVLTMFFLTAYGFLNLCAGFEGLVGSPSWRPTFRVPWALSLLGAFSCLAAMFMINPGAAFVAVFVTVGVYALIRRRRVRAYWGDLRYGILMLWARYALYRLAEREPDVHSWRPNILVLSGSPATRWYLVALADALSHGRGFLTVAAILPTETDAGRLESTRESIRAYLTKRRVPALVKVQASEDVFAGARALVHSYGFGPVIPNTVLLGETEQAERMAEYAELLMLVSRTRRNLVIVRERGEPTEPLRGGRIDIWWGGRSRQNAGLMLAFGHLLQTSPEWSGSRLVLKRVVEDAAHHAEALASLQAFIHEGRLTAESDVLVDRDGDLHSTISASSVGASLVFLGMRPPGEQETIAEYQHYYAQLLAQTDRLPPTALVMATEEIEFQRIFEP